MTLTGHEASKDVLQPSTATSQDNTESSADDVAPQNKTESQETSQIDGSENTSQERRPRLGRFLRLRHRSRIKKIAAVVSVAVSVSVIAGVVVLSVFSTTTGDNLTTGAVAGVRRGSLRGKITNAY